MTSWSIDPAKTLKDARYDHAAVVDSKGRIYAVQGNCTFYASERYDPVTNGWTTLPSQAFERVNHTAAVDSQDRVYAIGGNNNTVGGTTSNVERFDPSTGKWSTIASMLAARAFHGTVVVGGLIYAIAGDSTSKAVERFDPAAGTWQSVAPLSTYRKYPHVAVDKSGRIYAIGGTGQLQGGVTPYLSSAERFDPSTGQWTAIASMSIGRTNAAIAVDGTGRIYMMGGNTGDSGTPVETTSAERFDPSTGAWTALPAMSLAAENRLGLSDALGRVYVIGGDWQDAQYHVYATQNAQQFDPSANSWTEVDLMTARTGHAVVETSGTLYVIGGRDANYNAIASVETFDVPIVGTAAYKGGQARFIR